MTTPQIIELVIAVALIATGIWQYRKRDAQGARYGSQSAVILFVIGAIVAIHALSLMDYHPTAAEADMIKAQAR